MNELTELDRARKIAAEFIPTEPSENGYVYLYLGRATYDFTSYEQIDDQLLASKRHWHLDETQRECVAWVGEGVNGRIVEQFGHPFVPTNIECCIKLCEGLSKADAQELERLLIEELGCVLDDERPDGCLANIRYFHNGPNCCKQLEAPLYKAGLQGGNAGAAATSVKTYAMTSDKTVIATGSMSELARQFDVPHQPISACCFGKQSGIWSRHLDHAIYFCKVEDYDTYKIKPMTTKEYSRNRILIAAKLDGSDIIAGTASEIATYAPEIKRSQHLHAVARGEHSHAYGWVARYLAEVADETSAPVTTCGPDLSAFF